MPGAFDGIEEFLLRGGAAMWVIAALSVLALAVILWKLWWLWSNGAWTGAGSGLVDRITEAAARARSDLPDALAREETERVARAALAEARAGLRFLDLTVTIAPLLGLLGTVLGMIEAFQALQSEGSGADAAVLAGGIWEALLTTAAGMAVAIPVWVALTWFESVIERMQRQMEDAATRVFTGSARA